MGEPLTIGIPYVGESGKEVKKVTIDFVSNAMLRDYNKLARDLEAQSEILRKYSEKKEEVAGIIIDKNLSIFDRRKKAKPVTDEIRKYAKELKSAEKNNLIESQISLIHMILQKNGCTDKDLLSVDWWDENTEPSTGWAFLSMVIAKDMSGAKKKVNSISMKVS